MSLRFPVARPNVSGSNMTTTPRTLFLALAALALAAPAPAEQQDAAAPVAPGTRIRLTSCYDARALGCRVSRGTLSAWRADTVVVRPEGRAEPLGVPAAWVTRIEVSRSRGSATSRGIVVGLVPGLVMLAATAVWPRLDGTGGGCTRACAMTASLGVSVFGGAIGAFIGSGIRTERWRRLPLPAPR